MFSYNHQKNFYCVICEDEIPKLRFRQHKICDKLDCSIKHRKQCKEEQKKLEAEEIKRTVSKRLAIPMNEVDFAVVPAMTCSLESQPASRRKQFVAYLKKIVREGVNAEYSKDFESSELEFAPTKTEGNACHACGGDCCTGGGNHAYLKPDVFREIMDRHPGRSAAQLFREYLRRLPSESYEGSCVFHGEMGCTLDRDMRSNTCNTFRCTELIQLLDRNEAPPMIIARDGNEPIRFCQNDRVMEFETWDGAAG